MTTNLTELIMTRISHDLIGNAGAVANASELLEEGDLDFIEDIKSILRISSNVLNARLKFFRAAFGLANKSYNINDLTKICEDYIATVGSKNHPSSFLINIQEIADYKYILLGTMIVADTIIKGGKIRVEEENGTWYIVSEGGVIAPQTKTEEIAAEIKNNSLTTNAQFAPIVYLKELLKDSGYNLYALSGEDFFGIAIK